jgi:hypothetical protein
LHPPLSWTLGAILLTAVTITGVGQQSPEWYPIIGGLLGGPFLTIWNENRKKAAVDELTKKAENLAKEDGP